MRINWRLWFYGLKVTAGLVVGLVVLLCANHGLGRVLNVKERMITNTGVSLFFGFLLIAIGWVAGAFS